MIHGKYSFREELGKTVRLAIPLSGGFVGQMVQSLVDTAMVGQVGVVPLAAVSLTNAVLNFFYLIGIGLLTSLSVMISNAHGRDDAGEVTRVFQQGVYLATLTGFLLLGTYFIGWPLVGYLGQPEEVVAESRVYMGWVAGSYFWAFLYLALKNYSEAQSLAMPALWTGLIGVGVNVFLNWVLIFGNLGFPRMELDGAGIATFIARLVTLVLLWFWLKSSTKFIDSWPKKFLVPLEKRIWRKFGTLGIPVAFQLLIEVGAFSVCAILCGWLGAVSLAAHQIALTCAATTFMIPLGIGIAVTIRVGQAFGSGHPNKARVIGEGALALSASISAVFAIVFILFNEQLARLFTDDVATLQVAAGLIVIAGVFQLFDGTQVVAMGGLRGCEDVKIPTLIILAGFGLICIPLGAFLAFRMGYEADGIWIGLAIGLLIASSGLIVRFLQVTRKPA